MAGATQVMMTYSSDDDLSLLVVDVERQVDIFLAKTWRECM